jgi:hypothetical protein
MFDSNHGIFGPASSAELPVHWHAELTNSKTLRHGVQSAFLRNNGLGLDAREGLCLKCLMTMYVEGCFDKLNIIASHLRSLSSSADTGTIAAVCLIGRNSWQQGMARHAMS